MAKQNIKKHIPIYKAGTIGQKQFFSHNGPFIQLPSQFGCGHNGAFVVP